MAKYVTKKKEVVDLETGEVYTVISLIPEAKDQDFTKVFKLCSEKVLLDFKKTPGCVLLLFFIMNQLQYDDDRFYMHPKDAIKACGFSEKSFYTYVNLLIANQYIFKTDRKHWYRINPEMIFRGSVVRHYQNLIKRLPKMVQSSGI